MRQLPLQDLEAHLDFRKRVRHHLLVGRDTKPWEYQALVRHVVDHVGVVVGIDRAHPLMHARTVTCVLWLERWVFECLIDVGRNGAGLIDRKIAMPQDRHPLEWV